MKLKQNEPPRAFEVGHDEKILMHDCAHILLDPDEQVTLLTEAGAEYDVARKDFGFYATPSLNSRLPRFGLRAVLVKNRIDQFFLLLVERGRETLFERYVASEKLRIVTWLDSTERLEELERRLAGV